MAVKQDRLLPVSVIKDRLNVSKSHVYRLIREGEIISVSLGKRKGIRIFESDLRDFLQKKRDIK